MEEAEKEDGGEGKSGIAPPNAEGFLGFTLHRMDIEPSGREGEGEEEREKKKEGEERERIVRGSREKEGETEEGGRRTCRGLSEACILISPMLPFSISPFYCTCRGLPLSLSFPFLPF